MLAGALAAKQIRNGARLLELFQNSSLRRLGLSLKVDKKVEARSAFFFFFF